VSDPISKGIEIAAQCWCDEETSNIEMDHRLARAFAKRIDKYEEEINQLKSALANTTAHLNEQTEILKKLNNDQEDDGN
jgi:hypothetical protein